jgi:Uma2 family endonuclease
MAVFGEPKRDRGSYKQCKEENIAPQVVFEVLFEQEQRKMQIAQAQVDHLAARL